MMPDPTPNTEATPGEADENFPPGHPFGPTQMADMRPAGGSPPPQKADIPPPNAAEIDVAARAMRTEAGNNAVGHSLLAEWVENDLARAALTAAYAIRLPPLLAELERYREALERIVGVDEDDESHGGGSSPDYWSGTSVCATIARQALEEQREE